MLRRLTRVPSAPALPSDPLSPTEPCLKKSALSVVQRPLAGFLSNTPEALPLLSPTFPRITFNNPQRT